MATVYTAHNVTAANLITGSGRLLAFLITHAEAAAQRVTFYDNTTATGTVIADLHIAPERSPFYLRLSPNDAFIFSTGLSLTYTNCTVVVWAVEH
jgi:hypothetical protein